MTFTVCKVSWEAQKDAICAIRQHVFIEEQHVPVELELADDDPFYTYVLATTTAGIAVGTARIKDNGHIGRMAVLADWRGQGVGQALLTKIIELAELQKLSAVFCHAQVSAIPFYLQAGFYQDSDIFIDAGIPHQVLRQYL